MMKNLKTIGGKKELTLLDNECRKSELYLVCIILKNEILLKLSLRDQFASKVKTTIQISKSAFFNSSSIRKEKRKKEYFSNE